MTTHEHESHGDKDRPANSTTIPASLKLLPSSGKSGVGGMPERQERRTDQNLEQRACDIMRVIVDVENATQRHGTPDERAELADWLVCSSWTLGQIRAAAEIVAVAETYGRPLSREHWHKAFAEPFVHPNRIRELCREAFERGKEEGRKQASPEIVQSGMDAATKRLLDAEKELMTLREERNTMMTRIRELERDCRALQRRVGESSIRVYRKDERLIVEHYRENGEVYYHEQSIDETGVSPSRGRRMSDANFDRQIGENNVSVLTDEEIADLPGYGHWYPTL